MRLAAAPGELLALTWADVNVAKRTVLFRAVEVGARKTARSRELPMSASLVATIEMAQADAKQRAALGSSCYVRASLSPASRAQLDAIDLHFHDLRHEAGCRWLEGGMPLHHIQEMLGHTNLSQTSTYLHASEFGLLQPMQRLDAAKGKPLANETESGPPPLCQDDPAPLDKSHIH